MKKSMRRFALGSFALLACLAVAVSAQTDDILLIVHPDVALEELAQETVSEIYMGTRTKWDDGLTIRVAMLKTGDIHERFCQEIVKTTPSKLKNLWKKVVFTGSGTPPKIFKDEADLVEFVAETEGAIGYISKETPHEDVKTISLRAAE